MRDLPVPVTAPDEIRRITESVLARPEFAQAEPTWWQRVLQAVIDYIARAVSVAGAGDRGSIIGTVMLVAVAAVVLWAVIHFTRSVRSDPGRDIVVAGQIGRTAEQWLGDAAVAAAHGRWRDAVRCRYRALLAEFAAAGLVEEVPGRTSGEYLALVTTDVPAAAAAFGDVTRRFERAWYGDVPTTQADLEAIDAAALQVVRDAGIRRAAVLVA